MSACPVECGRTVQYGQGLCPYCWDLVPMPLKREVVSAWHGYQADVRAAAAGGSRAKLRRRMQELRSLQRIAVFSALERVIRMEVNLL